MTNKQCSLPDSGKMDIQLWLKTCSVRIVCLVEMFGMSAYREKRVIVNE